MKIGFLGLLGLLFITLKLTSVIAWSWWWVLLPLYAIPAIWLAVAFGAAALVCILALFNK